jgi:hypothetical protein
MSDNQNIAFDPNAPYQAVPPVSSQDTGALAFDPTAPYQTATVQPPSMATRVGSALNTDPNVQAIIGASEGATEHTQGLGPVKTLINMTPVGGFLQDLTDIPSEYRAYEAARSQGKSAIEAANIAAEAYKKKNDAIAQLKDTVKEFAANPGRVTGKAIADLLPVIIGGGLPEVAAPEAEAAADTSAATHVMEPSTADKPGVIRQLREGETIAQQPAQNAIRAAAQTAAEDAGVGPIIGPDQGIRTLMNRPIEAVAKVERGLYDTINEAVSSDGVKRDLKSLYDYREGLQDALEDPAQVANKSKLQEALTTTQDTIDKGEAVAQQNGVTLDTLDKARQATQQRYAMELSDQKLFNNESVIKGNVAHGEPETINVDAAIRQVETLDKVNKYAPRGTPTRLEQMLGDKGAKALKQSLYDARKSGQTALTRQNLGKGLLRYAPHGIGAAAGLGGIWYELTH